MKFKSALVTQVSGSVGGMVGSHNRGGLYFRARAIPTNPATAQQVAVRNIISQLVARWGTDDVDRFSWNALADLVTLTNPLGDPVKPSGINLYVRENTTRVQVGLTVIDTPFLLPGGFNPNLSTLSPVTLSSISAAGGTASLAYDNGDGWANVDGGFLALYLSRGQNPGISYFAGPYRFAGVVLGDATTPPTSPLAVTLPFGVSVGNAVFGQVRVVGGGLLSAPFRFSGVAGV